MDGSDGGLLPFDILVEILLKLPGKPLMRFKCVSKSWFSLITDPAFAELHNSRSHNRGDGGKFLVTRTNTEACLVCIIDMKKERVSVWEPSIPYGTDRMTNIVNGLICFYHKSYDKRLIRLYNLTSRESISLPSTQAEDRPWRSSDQFSRVCLLGFDPINKEYKVLHFYSQWTYHLGRHNVKCQLHTIGDRKKVWRPLDISHICDFVVNLICENVFCVDGFLYWTRRQVMIVFDVGREIFKLIPFPKEQSSFCLQSGLVKVHCRLYLVQVSHSRGLPCGTFEIIWWRLKEGKDTSDSHWTKEDVTRVTHENILAERGRRSLKVKCFNHLGQIFSARSPNSKISIIDYFDLVTGYRHKFEAFNPRGFLRLGISRVTEVVDNIMPLRNAFLVSE